MSARVSLFSTNTQQFLYLDPCYQESEPDHKGVDDTFFTYKGWETQQFLHPVPCYKEIEPRYRGVDDTFFTYKDWENSLKDAWVQLLIESLHDENVLQQSQRLQFVIGSVQLETLYSLRNRPVIHQFLKKHRQMLPFLLDAYPIAAKYFGKHLTIFLEVVHDPEMPGVEQLFAYISAPLPIETALECLNKLDEEWFIDRLEQVHGLFNFNLEIA